MTYWKIECLKKVFEIEETNDLNEKATITRSYLQDLKIKIKLMEEAYKEGLKDKCQKSTQEKGEQIKKKVNKFLSRDAVNSTQEEPKLLVEGEPATKENVERLFNRHKKGCGELFDFNSKVCGRLDYGLCPECENQDKKDWSGICATTNNRYQCSDDNCIIFPICKIKGRNQDKEDSINRVFKKYTCFYCRKVNDWWVDCNCLKLTPQDKKGCGKEVSQRPDILVCGKDKDLHGDFILCKDCWDECQNQDNPILKGCKKLIGKTYIDNKPDKDILCGDKTSAGIELCENCKEQGGEDE